MAREQRGIQSLEVGGELLLALARSPSAMALKDLAKAAGMSPSKAHPYLVSWSKLQLVEQDPITGRYDLGEQALRLGLTAIQRINPVRTALDELRQIEIDTRCSTAIAVWANMGPTIIHFMETDYPLNVYLRSGTVLSLANTAAGNVFAAYMPESIVTAALKDDQHRFAGQPEPTTLAELAPMIAKVRELGISRSIGQAVPGVNSICAPVFDASGKIALAISLMRPGTKSDADPQGEMARMVKATAARISERLGYGHAPSLDRKPT